MDLGLPKTISQAITIMIKIIWQLRRKYWHKLHHTNICLRVIIDGSALSHKMAMALACICNSLSYLTYAGLSTAQVCLNVYILRPLDDLAGTKNPLQMKLMHFKWRNVMLELQFISFWNVQFCWKTWSRNIIGLITRVIMQSCESWDFNGIC